MPSFGENLRDLRKSRGYSQDKFARILGSSQVNISAWELGTRMPNLSTIQHIADTFGVPVSTLIPRDNHDYEDDYAREVADILRDKPKVRMLFDRIKYMSDADIDTVIAVIAAITHDRVL